ncbi:hypothetical protein A5735_06960 [Mycolicibacter heraklionensis]|nr:hypothetical protein A5735_06960 [Mycolicibacter heraklionensis]
MRKFTALAAGVLVAGAAELSGAASADPVDWEGPGAWAGCVSRAGTATGAPVGSLTHYVTALYADTPGTGAPSD